VTLSIDNSVGQVDSASVTLSGGGSVTKTLSWSVPSSQTKQDYTATVASADDTASQTVTVSSGPPASLVAHWTFDTADTNSGTAVDVVGSNDGTISGATTGASGANQTYTTNEAYSFDGTDDTVAFPDNLGLTTDGTAGYSLAMWINVPSTASVSSRYDVVFSLRADHNIGLNSYSKYEGASGQTRFKIWDGSNEHIVTGTDVSGDGWVHLVATYAPSTGMKLYENGSSVGANSFTGTPATTGQNKDNLFGGDRDNDNFEGDADDVRVYDKALTSTEVSNLYTNGRI